MMKRLVCLLISIFMISALAGCNTAGSSDNESHNHNHDHTHREEVRQETENTAQQGSREDDSDTTAQQGSREDDSDTTAQQGSQPENSKKPTQQDETSPQGSSGSSASQNDAEEFQQVSEYPFTKEATGVLMKRHSDKIDIPFEQEYIKADSYAKRASACEKYTDEWKTIADRYYKEILYYNGTVPEDPNFSTDEEMHTYIENRKTQWEEEFEENCRTYLEQMKALYSDSDKVQALYGSYRFDYQREFALELIGIYEMLGDFNNQEF